MFGNRARSLHQYLSKGTKVAIEGKLRWSQWERDGQKRSKLEVIVDELEFMSSRNGGGAQSYGGDFGGNQGYAPAAPAYSAPAPCPHRLRRPRPCPLHRLSTLPLPCTMMTFRFKRNERG